MKVIKSYNGFYLYSTLVFKNKETVEMYSEGVSISILESHPSLALYANDMSSNQHIDKLSNESKIELCKYMEKRWLILRKKLLKLK